jgi:hypothetical protein
MDYGMNRTIGRALAARWQGQNAVSTHRAIIRIAGPRPESGPA